MQYVKIFPERFSKLSKRDGESQAHSVSVSGVTGRVSLDCPHLVQAQADVFHSQHFLSVAREFRRGFQKRGDGARSYESWPPFCT